MEYEFFRFFDFLLDFLFVLFILLIQHDSQFNERSFQIFPFIFESVGFTKIQYWIDKLFQEIVPLFAHVDYNGLVQLLTEHIVNFLQKLLQITVLIFVLIR